ncbi:MAG: hypothetical protein AAF462_09815 [Thermodesulfobacteriota bacterium]
MRHMILAAFLFSAFATTSLAGIIPGVYKGSWDLEIGTGQFCNVESAQVCVLTQNEEDCKKLEGKKVDSCPSSEEEK